ncbi:hypothetical protein [Streptomyces sp. NPDC093111]|uniref:hypothetical protein n=1 Tax=Streptomyces sp. NPDC093111 TaxID=3154978 RepID=UPI003422C376
MLFEDVRARGLAGAGVAAALLLALPGTALAAPAPGPLDVEAGVTLRQSLARPGGTIQVQPSVKVRSGTAGKLGFTFALPAGVTFLRLDGASAPSDPTCAPAADGRSVTCVSPRAEGADWAAETVYVQVGKDVAPGTELPFTVTADIGDAVDSKPENNTATRKVEVRTPGDLSVEWKLPPGPVHPGKTVRTEVVVTNHGPGPVPFEALRLYVDDPWPGGYDSSCWADPATLTCDHFRELAPGGTLRYPFTWTFPAKAAGTTYKVEARSHSTSPLDPNDANDRAIATFKVEKATGPKPTPTRTTKPTPTSTPTSTPAPTAQPSTSTPAPSATATATTTPPPAGDGGGLANTGAGPLAALAGTAAAAAGAGLLLLRNRRAGAGRR